MAPGGATINHRLLGALFLLLLGSGGFLFARPSGQTFRSAVVTLHLALGAILLLGFLSIRPQRNRGRGASFVTGTSLAALSALIGLAGYAMTGSDPAWITAHAALGAAAAVAFAYRWLVVERHVAAARLAGLITVAILVAAGLGRCRASREEPAPPPPSPAAAAAVHSDSLAGRLGDEALAAQVRRVIDAVQRTGRPPQGVAQGGRRGGVRGEFLNLEGRLPRRPRGYYRESDVWPRSREGRGAVRLVFGREGEVYYSPDHYRTFLRIDGES